MPDHSEKLIHDAQRSIISDFPLSIVISDPNLPDNPIVYVNRAFEKTTGYAASYAIGRNCRFLQGDDRDQPEVDRLRAAIDAREPVTVDLVNYRLDGTPFTNRLTVTPLRREDHPGDDTVDWTHEYEAEGDIYAFMGIQSSLPVDEAVPTRLQNMLEETQHRVKNHLAMVAGMVRMGKRDADSVESAHAVFDQLSHRVEALSLLYDEFTRPPVDRDFDYDVVSAGGYVSRVVSTIVSLDGRVGIRVNIDADPVYMPTERAGKIGLLTSEVVSNMLQHAFPEREEGNIEVRLKEQGEDSIRLTFSDDGVGLGEMDWPRQGSLGARIVRTLVRNIDAELNVITSEHGTVVTVDFVNSMGSAIDGTGDRKRLSGGDSSRIPQHEPG